MDKIKIEGSYIQYAAGYDKDDITGADLAKALFEEDKNYKISQKHLESAKEYFDLLLSGRIGELKEKLKSN